MRIASMTIALLLVSFELAFSQTSVPPGNVSGTWMLSGSPYRVQGDITVPNDSSLMIEAGVTVVFHGHYALNVQGRLLAIGTMADSIRFTVNDTTGFSDTSSVQGGWYGIRLLNTPSTNDSTILAYCRLEYGKAVGPDWPSNTGGAISIANFSKVRISNCLVAHNMAGGSQLPGGGGIGLTAAHVLLGGNLIIGNHSTGQGGGLLVNGSNVRSVKNRFVGNTTSGQGGGVLIEGTCSLVFQGDTIANNRSRSSGGGMYAYGQSQMRIEGVSVVANAASWGGGLAVFSCTLSVNSCAFGGNTATTQGGAIGANFSSLDIGGSMIALNRCGSEGGGIYAYRSDLRIRSSSGNSNRAGGDSLTGTGGAIYVAWGTLHIDSCSFLRDTAWVAAGLRVYNGDLLADSVAIQENFASNLEGGLYWSADSMIYGRPFALNLKRVGFLRNKATNNYAAAYVVQPTTDKSLADVVFDRCTFAENSSNITPALGLSGTFKGLVISNTRFLQNAAGSRTSGLSFAGGTSGRVFNCLFAGNHTAGGVSVGAGLSMGGNCDIDINNCTFAFNTAASGSALSVRSGAKGRITNSIFWKNSGVYIALATVASAGGHMNINYCSLQHGQDSINVSDSLSTLVWGSGNIDGDPLFKDSTGGDLHLRGGSPCIAAGVDSIEVEGVWQLAPVTDIEGLPRPRPAGTHPDMGAFEDQLIVPVGVAMESGPDRPSTIVLRQNYPNPFNPNTTIPYELPERSLVRLTVYDMLGREVALLVHETKAAGAHEVKFGASILSSGVYLYTLQAGGLIQSRKLLILR